MLNNRATLTFILLTLGIALCSPSAVANPVCGDCNSDGAVNIADANFAATLAATPSLRTGGRLLACDVDQSGGVDIIDALLIASGAPLSCKQCGDCNASGGPPTAGDCNFIRSIAGGGAQPMPGTSFFAACDVLGNGDIADTDADACDMGNFPCAQCADCNLDGSVTILDALVAAQNGAGVIVIPPGSCQFRACDADGSGFVDALDALVIAREAAGLNPPLACP